MHTSMNNNSIMPTQFYTFLVVFVFQFQSELDNGVFPKWSRTFIEFSEYRESDKSSKNELSLI